MDRIRTRRALASLAAAGIVAAALAVPVSAAKQTKTEICHWSEADQQYVVVSVANGLTNKGHVKHTNDIAFDGDCVI